MATNPGFAFEVMSQEIKQMPHLQTTRISAASPRRGKPQASVSTCICIFVPSYVKVYREGRACGGTAGETPARMTFVHPRLKGRHIFDRKYLPERPCSISQRRSFRSQHSPFEKLQSNHMELHSAVAS